MSRGRSWATIYFDDPTATSFDYRFYDGGTASGVGALWAQGTVQAVRYCTNLQWLNQSSVSADESDSLQKPDGL